MIESLPRSQRPHPPTSRKNHRCKMSVPPTPGASPSREQFPPSRPFWTSLRHSGSEEGGREEGTIRNSGEIYSPNSMTRSPTHCVFRDPKGDGPFRSFLLRKSMCLSFDRTPLYFPRSNTRKKNSNNKGKRLNFLLSFQTEIVCLRRGPGGLPLRPFTKEDRKPHKRNLWRLLGGSG